MQDLTPTPARHHDTAALLRTEHAVAHVLAESPGESAAHPRLLAAIGEELEWDFGGLWTATGGDGELHCVETWQGPRQFERLTRDTTLAPGEGLPGRVWASGEPAWIADVGHDVNLPRGQSALQAGLRSAFCFPIRGSAGVIGAVEFFAREPRDPDANLLATMSSLGGRIGQCIERWRAEDLLRESDARKTAILDAAFDCVITMDADGIVVEVNHATEEMFGYTSEQMVGRELAELIVPPALREPHRRGVERLVSGGERRMAGHPVELPAMRADGSEFPVEIAITQPRLPGAPLFTGFMRDITERRRSDQELRALAEEQAALRRVATTVASEAPDERVFALVTEEVGRLLGAQTANLLRFEPGGAALVVGEWSTGSVRSVPLGTHVPLDGPTAAAQIYRSGRPARVDSYENVDGGHAEMLRELGFRSAVGSPIRMAGRLWGAVAVSSVEDKPFPAGAEQRLADFAELVGLALANAEARRELAASRARIVETGDAERRRLERNLHDGAQQQLVSLALTLRMCERRLDGDAAELIRQAQEELSDALAELRELARGIHPAVLTEGGLNLALELLAKRSGIPVELALELDERLPAPVEAAAYYLVAEALTNASKHADAQRVHVDVRRRDGAALVVVTDDGVGGADHGAGTGLRGLADRVEALGGSLELVSPPGIGTTIRARLPL